MYVYSLSHPSARSPRTRNTGFERSDILFCHSWLTNGVIYRVMCHGRPPWVSLGERGEGLGERTHARTVLQEEKNRRYEWRLAGPGKRDG